MKRKFKYLLLVTLLILVAGCANVGNQALKEETKATVSTKIKEGVTHENEVISMLGEPTEKSFTDGGLVVMRYSYARQTPRAQNFIPYNFFSIVNDVHKKELIVLLDENNIVKKINFTESEYEQRGGIAE